MNKLYSGLAAASLAAAVAVTGAIPASAAPLFLQKSASAQSDVIQVRDGWYRGYRGYRNYRPGYRYNNGLWFPAGAFVAGALIGGAIANNNYYGGYYRPNYYNSFYGGSYYPRAYYPDDYYYQRRVYYPPQGSAYRQGYRDGFRDGVNARYNSLTCTQRLSDAGKC